MNTNTMIKRALCLMVAAGMTFAIHGATGDNWKNAASISAGKSTTVTLVEERDPDTKETLGSGVYYMKMTASRNSSYTITVTPNNAENGVMADISDVSSYDFEKEVLAPAWDSSTDGDEITQRLILHDDDWDDEYDKSVTYYLRIDGDIGAKVKVSMADGEKKYSWPAGSEEKPVSITVGTKESSSSSSLVGEMYYFKAKLTKNVLYKFWTTGGTTDYPLDVVVYSDDGYDVDIATLSGKTTSANSGISAVPSGSGNCIIVVTGSKSGAKFGLSYVSVPSRKASGHKDAINLGAIDETGVSVDCAPGLRNNPASGYYDGVIDTTLYKMKLKAGKYYSFETSGATAPIVLELYKTNSTAAVVANSRGFAKKEYDCKLVYKCPADAVYYVGVCQEPIDEDTGLVKTPCTFSAKLITGGVMDAFDPADDTYTGATAILPGLGVGKKLKSLKEEGAKHGPHTFGAMDWVDTYTLSVRAGVTYNLATVLRKSSDKSGDAWPLAASIYTLSGKTKRIVRTIDNLNKTVAEITPRNNAVYYIEVAPEGGQGVDYGAYDLYALAVTNSTMKLGVLDVRIGGLSTEDGGGWSIKSDGKKAVVYPSGPIALPAGKYTVGFTPVSGWSAPTATVTVVAGATKILSRKYSDLYDAANIAKDATDGDGSRSGKRVPTLKFSGVKTQKASRSLYKEDAADWFKFKSSADTYYTFSLAGAGVADAVITVYRVKDTAKNIVATTAGTTGNSVTFLCKDDAKNYYVAVTHRDAAKPEDAQYTLKYNCQNVGVVGFAKSSYSVKDDADSVELTVKRTGGTDGAVRVRWTTRSGTGSSGAKAGDAYVAANGFLSWADGDKSNKKITVKLLPEQVKGWSPTRKFAVELAEVDKEDANGTLPPGFGKAKATVKISDASKQVLGTIQFAESSVSVRAGEPLTITVNRVDGSDGEIGAIVTQTPGSAKAKTDYKAWSKSKQSLVWADGDDEPKTVTLQTLYPNAGYQTDRKMTLTLEIDKSKSSAAKLGKTAKETVTIVDPSVTQTFAAYQAACKERKGIAVQGTGTWYFNEIGILKNASPKAGEEATFTLTLTGPGKFAFTPNFNNGGSSKNVFSCKIDKTTQKVANGTRVLRYFGDGTHTVVFTVSRDAKKGGTGAEVAFAPQDGVQPFLWKPLSAPAAVSPLPLAVIDAAASEEGGEGVAFRWVDSEDDEVQYRFSLATTKKDVSGENAANVLVYNASVTNGASFIYRASGEGEGATVPFALGKTYYWRVDAVMPYESGAGEIVATNSVYSFDTLAVGAPLIAFRKGTVDAFGNPVEVPETTGLPWKISLVQGVSARVELTNAGTGDAGETFAYSLIGGALPNGMSVANASGRISGVPTAVGDSTALLQISKVTTTGSGKNAKTEYAPGGTIAVTFSVQPINLAAGTFNGLLTTQDERVTDDRNDGIAANSFGAFNLIAAESGKLTAKVTMGGTAYTFTSKGWTSLVNEDMNALPQVTATLTATNYLFRSSKSFICVTNELTFTACRAAADEEGALDAPLLASLKLTLLSKGKAGYVRDVVWTGTAVRDNRGVGGEMERIKPWAGYYTVALAPMSAVKGVQGNGYLTVTISEKGKAKVAGLLADGITKVSCSAVCAYLSENASASEIPELLFPVYSGSATSAFGGWLRMTIGTDGTPFVRSAGALDSFKEPLRWMSTASAATLDGTGFDIVLEPVGGLYNTVANLQRYYYDLAYDWTIPELCGLAELSGYLLTSTYNTLLAYPGDEGTVPVSIKNDDVSVASQKLYYRSDNKKLIDWGKTRNACNLKFALVRATGIYSGLFELWGVNNVAGADTKQKNLATCKHYGVLLMARDINTTRLPELENLAPGFYNVSLKVKDAVTGVKRNVMVSYPFVVRPVVVDNNGWVEELPRDSIGD